jgi:hypothetical protein
MTFLRTIVSSSQTSDRTSLLWKISSRKTITKVLLLATIAGFASAVSAQTVVYSVNAGRWSDPNTWSANRAPNCDFVVVKTAVVLDQDVGIGCGGSKWIRVENNGSLTLDNSQPRTIKFASTGTDPIGSGSMYNPGGDATMFGFFVSGLLDLEGTPANWVTVTSYNDASPIYIHHERKDFVGCTTLVNNVCNGQSGISGAILKLRYVNAKHLGTAVQYFDGINWDMRSGTTPANSLDIQLSQFSDLNQIAHYYYVSSTGGYNFSGNTIIAPRQATTLFVDSHESALGWIIADNTEIGGVVEGQFMGLIGPPSNFIFERNAVLGTAQIQRGLLQIKNSGGTGDNTIADNLCYDPEPLATSYVQCIFYSGNPDDVTSQISSNVLYGSWQPLTMLGGSPQVLSNWFDEFREASSGQGDLIAYGYAVNPHVAYNIHLLENDNSNILSLLISDGGPQPLSARVEHNTYVGLGASDALFLGEGWDTTLAVYNSYARSNLIVGGTWGIVDGNPYNTWSPTDSYNGAGVHHNDVYNVTMPYSRPGGGSIGFDDGVHPHPDARYGDITANPVFLDATRRPAGFDAFLGGPGTMDHFFGQLALRNGFGGNYDQRYNIAAMLGWLRAGYIPRNLALRGKAHDGKDIGAMPVVVPNILPHN